MMLSIEAIHTYYGQSHILQDVSLEIDQGECVALLGRNGAGKTTTMRSIMGLTPPKRGRIALDGAEITGLAPHQIARAGLGYVPSGRRIFSELTVRQNLELAAHDAKGTEGPWDVSRVLEMFPKLHELAGRGAGFLSGGEQQMLKLGRALLRNPKLLLLDEPTEGLAPVVVKDLFRWIERLKGEHLSILLSEQNSAFALNISDRGYILEKGRIRFSAPAQDLAESQEIRTYLGIASKPAAE
jgi:branched-chain amino acid transport system ATP-binding protein